MRIPRSFAFWTFVAWLAITILWWALAFAPLPRTAEWLAEARTVCFGTLPNGLPDTWGWVSLVGTPLAMLAFLVAVWGRELGGDLRELGSSRVGRVVLACLLFLPLVGVFQVGTRIAEARRMQAALEFTELPESLPDAYPRGTEPAPATRLVDQSGAEFSIDQLRGRPVLVTFAFAHCETVCPVVVNTVRSAAREAAELEPAVVVVTLDPWRDRPSTLERLASHWDLEGLSAHVLSGEVEDVLASLDEWQMPHDRDPQNGDIAHPALVHVLDPEGRMAYAFLNPPVEWVVEAASRVAG